MEIIVVNRPLQNKEEEQLLSRLSSDQLNIELFANVTVSSGLEGFSKRTIELTPDEKKEINYAIFDRVLKFGEIKIEGTAITDLLTVEKASIWHYHKFRTYFFIRNLIFEIRLIEKLATKYDSITYYSESAFLKNYPFDQRIKLKVPESVKLKTNYFSVFNYSVFFLLRVILAFFQILKYRKARHIIIDHAIKQTVLNLRTLKPEPGNYNLEYLFEKLDHEFLILDDVDFPKFHKGNDFNLKKWHLKAKGHRLFGELIIFHGILSSSVRNQLSVMAGRLKEKYKLIRTHLSDPIDLLMLDYISSLHGSSRLFLFKYLSYKKFFNKNRFLTVSTIDENSARIKSILDAAKIYGIKTIGIQHGTIHDLHPAYMFTKGDVTRKPMPDFTLVWGENWKKILSEKGNYDPDSLVITGQIRTDIIEVLEKRKSSLEFRKAHPGKTLILFASQFQRDLALRERAAIDILQIAKKTMSSHLIIKLHPSEKNEAGYYHSLANEVGCRNYEIKYYTDLYLLISRSDIISTCFSTVGTEAIYFNKPLIIIDYLKQDIQNYYKSGIALQATNNLELQQFVEMVVSGQYKINATKYELFIRNYAYRIDGKVAERIVAFLKS
jgi:hypothetical protein